MSICLCKSDKLKIDVHVQFCCYILKLLSVPSLPACPWIGIHCWLHTLTPKNPVQESSLIGVHVYTWWLHTIIPEYPGIIPGLVCMSILVDYILKLGKIPSSPVWASSQDSLDTTSHSSTVLSHIKFFWTKTSACRDGTLKIQPDKMEMIPQYFHNVPTSCAILVYLCTFNG